MPWPELLLSKQPAQSKRIRLKKEQPISSHAARDRVARRSDGQEMLLMLRRLEVCGDAAWPNTHADDDITKTAEAGRMTLRQDD